MSLVDYASSSDNDSDIEEKEEEAKDDRKGLKSPSSQQQDSHLLQSVVTSSLQQSNSSLHSSMPSIEKLPDASMLLNSPPLLSHQMSNDDHSSRVAAAMAESASRKRESNGSMLPFPRRKLPKGNLRHSRNVPDTVGGLLVPPQLSGRGPFCPEFYDRAVYTCHFFQEENELFKHLLWQLYVILVRHPEDKYNTLSDDIKLVFGRSNVVTEDISKLFESVKNTGRKRMTSYEYKEFLSKLNKDYDFEILDLLLKRKR